MNVQADSSTGKEVIVMAIPKCINPRGPLYCNDPACPALDETGRHIVTVASTNLSKGLQERLNKKPLPPAKPKTKTTQKTTQKTAPQAVTSPEPLFDMDAEWVDSRVNFRYDANGAEPAFYAEQGNDVIVAKINGGKKRDVYIIAKGALRVIYGTHTIRTTAKLISIGIDSDRKLQRALDKELIKVASQPKFEAVEIRYMGRRDETRTPIGVNSSNLATVIFETIKYLND